MTTVEPARSTEAAKDSAAAAPLVVTADDLTSALSAMLSGRGVPSNEASVVAGLLVEADLRGATRTART